MSALRKFLAGDYSVAPNYTIDVLIWLNYHGYKSAAVHGKPLTSLIKRDDAASVSLEKWLMKFVVYLFQPNMSNMKKEELYLRFTNRMDVGDAEIVYLATEGKLNFDLDQIRAYAGDRRFGGAPDGDYIFRNEYVETAPVAVTEEKVKEPVSTEGLDALGATDEEDEAPVVAPAAVKEPDAQPEKPRRGRRPKTAV